MKIAIGSDRCGFDYKRALIGYMKEKKIDYVDVGTLEKVPSDSPYFASKVGKLVASGDCNYGVLSVPTVLVWKLLRIRYRVLCVQWAIQMMLQG